MISSPTAQPCFNSQRDGILRKDFTFGKIGYKRFNSQRDGILLRDIYSAIREITFQFPTGWNSTNLCVTISFAVFMFQFPTGWNSTTAFVVRFVMTSVSIPNGMEFYGATRRSIALFSCFNSQRDGILPYMGFNTLELKGVSIPNGMEFYHQEFTADRRRSVFQFPTGWNSTQIRAHAELILSCFNSQRDGILQKLFPSFRNLRKLFQFPTGWNSTLA